MFRTFRVRLLFWFLVFISSSFVIILLSLGYINIREEIFAKSEAIDQAYLILLKSVQAQKDFFSYDTKNRNYFLNGQSQYLEQYQLWLDSTRITLKETDFSQEADLQQEVIKQFDLINRVDFRFRLLTEKIKERGYKDYSLEGAMRADAHWLESAAEIPTEMLLSVRRYEKDYIIRNEYQYVEKLKAAIDQISTNLRASGIRRDSILNRLNRYESNFLRLVTLDQDIGIKDNSGLKLSLDREINKLEAGFGRLVNESREWARAEFDQLTLYFGITVILLVLVSIIISAFIAHKITQPLRKLTTHITRFVESNFTLEKEHPVVKSKDEIGSLTKNFSILKNEVISQMKFFKKRVEERTRELADANDKLAVLSEANSRFVPTAFLENLGKESIVEVALGDQVEREMTVVFTDIRGFTSISEELSPQEIFDFLNDYLGGIVPIILKHGGFIDKFIGDSVMALFPKEPDHAIDAVMEFGDFVRGFNERLVSEKGMSPIHVGSGIHTGSMILGTIGHNNRLETTVISDAVNTAARVEGLTKHYDTSMIMTEDTMDRLKNKGRFHYRFLDKVQVKGKSKVLSVYQLLPMEEELRVSYMPRYNEAVDLLKQGQMDEAVEILEALAILNPNDKVVGRFLGRFRNFEPGTSSTWGEVTSMTKK